jgi:hypothetical protein
MMNPSKSLPITKSMVWDAYKLVRRKGKAAGVDGLSLDDFAEDLENNLYQLWNRMASGSYFPPPVRRVETPKAGGGVRPLGIRTVADRIAQAVIKQRLEPELDRVFDPDSYGYRPGKSGWDQYYGRFYPTELRKLFEYFGARLGAWLQRKYKQLAGHRGRALRTLNGMAQRIPRPFVHWQRLGRATVG